MRSLGLHARRSIGTSRLLGSFEHLAGRALYDAPGDSWAAQEPWLLGFQSKQWLQRVPEAAISLVPGHDTKSYAIDQLGRAFLQLVE